MREMGTVELLTREGEIVIAKRIEEGIRELLAALAFYPGIARKLCNEYDLVAKEERKLSDILVGYLIRQIMCPRLRKLQSRTQTTTATTPRRQTPDLTLLKRKSVSLR